MVTGICRLCNNEKKLLSSHIIPKSYFKYLKSGASQLAVIQEGDKKSQCLMLTLRKTYFVKAVRKF